MKAGERSTPLEGGWLVTGAAGFIGSNLVEHLLRRGARVIGLDDFSTGHRRNLDDVRAEVEDAAWANFTLVEGDIADADVCRTACDGVSYVLHQAARGSVPRSLADPVATNRSNVDGFLNMLLAARDAGVKRFVYASSSSVYGDSPELPKREPVLGRPLSPYAVSKCVDELYAHVFERNFGLETIGLRYFNVFGRRQDPDGAYAAVIPLWIANLLAGRPCVVNGDGETSRDFCYVENVVQANLRAALAEGPGVTDSIYNIAIGDRTTLNELFRLIRDGLARHVDVSPDAVPEYGDFRPGDIRHSQADISRARERLGYRPEYDVRAGLAEALPWYVQTLRAEGVVASGHGG